MLVLISDIHLSDGTTASNVAPEAFNILRSEIIAAYEENNAQELHLVLLGDIFDLVRSTYWIEQLKPEERPWNGEFNKSSFTFENENSEKHYQKVLNDILKPPDVMHPHVAKSSAPDLIKVCKSIKELYKDQFRLTYVTGNHDQAINCYDSLKEIIVKEMPFMDINKSFKHSVNEKEYSVLARHGHEWDGDCYSLDFYNKVLKENRAPQLERFSPESYNIMSIGEVITAEFMSGLLHYIYQKLDKNNPEEMNFFKKLKDVNNVRPMKNSFEWLLWFIGDKYSKYEKIIEDALLQSTEGVYKSKYGKLWDKTKIGDQTDIFWILNKIASLRNEKILRKIAGFVGGDDNLPYINGAMEEFSNPKHKNVQYIFYGHTHNGLHRFAGGEPGGKSRLYVNTGTYLPFIDRASDKTFASAYQMTLAFVYSIEEDYDKHKGGRKNAFPTLDLWNGIKKKVYP